MKILFIEWSSYGKEDIRSAMEKLGHEVISTPLTDGNYRKNPKYKSELKHLIREKNIDAVFSSNYYPVVSDACEAEKTPYLSWCYDSPLLLLYTKSVFNSCNRIFVFDSYICEDLQSKGVEHIYYLPMAVDGKRLSAMQITQEDREKYQSDISFVGAMYTEKNTLFDRMQDLDIYTKGYLEGIMRAQKKVYGYYFLEELLIKDIVEKMQDALRYETAKDGFETVAYVYASYFLCRKIAEWERRENLEALSEQHEVKLYTPASTPFLPHVKNMGTVDYRLEMPKVFACSKINLNMSLRSIVSGIPLRAMDIMGAGGFLMTNFQEDFLKHFVPGEDFVYYESEADLCQKAEYYLNHEEERIKIAKAGQKKVLEEHTYEKRVQEMLSYIQ